MYPQVPHGQICPESPAKVTLYKEEPQAPVARLVPHIDPLLSLS